MRLRDLDAMLLLIVSPTEFRTDVATLAEAQGIMFLCPKCFMELGGPVGIHSVICWFKERGVPDDMDPKPGRWNPSGTGIDDLTFVPPGAVSVALLGDGCKWHGFVRNGDAT